MKQPKKKASQILSAALAVLLMLVGLALVLYPTVADTVNDSINQGIITDYLGKAEGLDSQTYQDILDAAATYNDALAMATPYITSLTGEKRAQYKSLLNLDGTGVMGYVSVPKCKIYLPIYHGTEESVLQTGVGHLEGSSLPVEGKSVHIVLTGHSGLPSARLFTDLDQLQIGDTFSLHILNETLTYRVEKMARVSPEDLETMQILEGQELCTLLTCTPYGINTHRLVVTGRRIETPAEPAPEQPDAVTQIVASKWNWWFLFLPAIAFVGITVGAVWIYRRRKAKRQQH